MSVLVRELTASAPGGVAVLAFEGEGARRFVERLVRRAVPLRTPTLARLVRDGEALDEIVVAAFSDQSVELHLHASVPLVRALRRWIEREPGIAAALGDPVLERLAREAPCEAAARTWLDQRDGALARAMDELRELDRTSAMVRLDELLEGARRGRFLLRPARVLLAGPVNAGKSTLFNALAGRERALTSAEPGTTRDLLREPALLGDWPVELWDGAGERSLADDGSDDVERAGQALARDAAREADLVLWLAPASADVVRPPDPSFVVVRTQDDRGAAASCPQGAVSALVRPGEARARVAELFRARFELPERAWAPGRAVPWDESLVAELRILRELGGCDRAQLRRLASHAAGS